MDNNKDQNSAGQIKALEEKVDQVRLAVQANKVTLIEQEHRFVTVLINLFKSFRHGNSSEKMASLKALFHLFLPGRITVLIASGGMIGILTLLLMQKNNELIANQIYVQANTDRRTQIAILTEKLYKETEESKAKLAAWTEKPNSTEDPSSELKPFFNEHIRTVALKQYVEIIKEPLLKPDYVPNETLWHLAKRWGCKNIPEICNMEKQESEELEITLNLEKALLSGVTWPDTKGVKVSAVEATLIDANLKGAYLFDANLFFTNLKGANLRGADLRGARLVDANLRLASLDGARLSGADLFDANLKGASLFDANLKGANLEGSNLREADLRGARLTGADLSGADLSNANLEGATLIDAYLAEADLSGADLRKVRLRGASLFDANLKGANMEGASLIDADLTAADLSGADLRKVRLRGASLFGANLKGANLEGASLIDANLEGVIGLDPHR